MTFYLYYYLTIVSLLVLEYSARSLERFSKKGMSPFFAIAILLTIFISGFRYNTGYDFLNYVRFYNEPLHLNIEPLFAVSIAFFKIFSDDPQLMFFAYSSATILILLLAVKRFTKYTKTSFLFFLLIPGLFLNSFSIIRQSLAMVILFYGVSFLLLDNGKRRFVIIASVAAMFHYSAIFPALLFFFGEAILKKEYTFKTFIFLALLSLVLYYFDLARFLLGFAIGRYSLYSDNYQPISLIKILILNLFMFFLVLHKRRFAAILSDIFLLNSVFIGVLITNIFASFTPLTRFSYFFLIAQIILVPKLIYAIKENSLKLFFLAVFMCYYSFMIGNALMVDLNFGSYPKMTPYENYFIKR